MTKKSFWGVFAVLLTLSFALASATPALAQMSEVKEKPPMYSYVSFWNIPRGQWGEMEKNDAADQPILDKAYANGAIVGYGNDVNLVHEADGYTHDEWWSSMSMAGLLNTLEEFYKSGNATTSVLGSSTRHSDEIFVSRYYNWHSGSWKGAYTHVSSYKLKPDAGPNAVGMLSKTFIVPLMEKLLSDGAIQEYEVDTEAIHKQSPDTFWIVYIAAKSDGLDKANAALDAALKANPMAGPAFGSMVDFAVHRDDLARTSGAYK